MKILLINTNLHFLTALNMILFSLLNFSLFGIDIHKGYLESILEVFSPEAFLDCILFSIMDIL